MLKGIFFPSDLLIKNMSFGESNENMFDDISIYILTRHYSFKSVVNKMLDMGSSLYNISYHPILDNYPEYDNIPRTTFNEALKFPFMSLIETGDWILLFISSSFT